MTLNEIKVVRTDISCRTLWSSLISTVEPSGLHRQTQFDINRSVDVLIQANEKALMKSYKLGFTLEY